MCTNVCVCRAPAEVREGEGVGGGRGSATTFEDRRLAVHTEDRFGCVKSKETFDVGGCGRGRGSRKKVASNPTVDGWLRADRQAGGDTGMGHADGGVVVEKV